MTHTERQAVLFDEGREFTFLLTEAVLRTWPGSLTVMAAQFDRLRQLTTQPGVRLASCLVDDAARTAECCSPSTTTARSRWSCSPASC